LFPFIPACFKSPTNSTGKSIVELSCLLITVHCRDVSASQV
jgi:hypothetical protein